MYHRAYLVDELVAFVEHVGVLHWGVHGDALVAPARRISYRETDIRGLHLRLIVGGQRDVFVGVVEYS